MNIKYLSRFSCLLLATSLSLSANAEGLGLQSLVPSPDSRTGMLASISDDAFTIELDGKTATYQVDENTTFCMDGKEVASLSNFDGIEDKTISIETIKDSPFVKMVYKGKMGMRVFSAGSLRGTKLGPRCEQLK